MLIKMHMHNFMSKCFTLIGVQISVLFKTVTFVIETKIDVEFVIILLSASPVGLLL